MIYIAFHFRYDKVRICQPYLQYLYEGFHRESKPILNITSSNIADYRYLHFGSNTPGLVSIMLDLQFFFPITPHYDVYYDFLRRELLEQLFFREYMVETVGTYLIVHQFQGRPILPQEVNWLNLSLADKKDMMLFAIIPSFMHSHLRKSRSFELRCR